MLGQHDQSKVLLPVHGSWLIIVSQMPKSRKKSTTRESEFSQFALRPRTPLLTHLWGRALTLSENPRRVQEEPEFGLEKEQTIHGLE